MKTIFEASSRLDHDEFARFFFGLDESFAENSARTETKAEHRVEPASSQQSKDCIFDASGNVAI